MNPQIRALQSSLISTCKQIKGQPRPSLIVSGVKVVEETDKTQKYEIPIYIKKLKHRKRRQDYEGTTLKSNHMTPK